MGKNRIKTPERTQDIIQIRKGKLSKGRFYLQGSKLKQSEFKPGSHFTYIASLDNNKIIILPSENENDNVVSKRTTNGVENPVIDIRNKKALMALAGSDYLQITILKDKVIVEGYKQAQENAFDRAASYIKDKLGITKKPAKVTHISDLVKVTKTAEVVLSKKDFKNAVGQNIAGQISIDEFLGEVKSAISETSRYDVVARQRLDNLKVHLEVLSLYSGAGFLDLAFQKAGYEIMFALDFMKEACETYRHNIGDHIRCANALEFDMGLAKKSDIMIAGPFCKKLSKSNRKDNVSLTLEKAENLLDHPQNILIKRYIDWINYNDKCKVAVIENVPELISLENSNGTLLEDIMNALPDFEFTYGVLNAAHFGAPQLRQRAIVIASKIGKIELPVPTHTKENYVTVRDAFSRITSDLPNQDDYTRSGDDVIERMRHVPQGGNFLCIPEHLRTKAQHSNSYRRLSLDAPSITMVNYRKPVIIHPTENRTLSVREAATLQGWPLEKRIYGGLSSMQEQVGNAVPVQLGYAIAKKIREAIEAYNSKIEERFAFGGI